MYFLFRHLLFVDRSPFDSTAFREFNGFWFHFNWRRCRRSILFGQYGPSYWTIALYVRLDTRSLVHAVTVFTDDFHVFCFFFIHAAGLKEWITAHLKILYSYRMDGKATIVPQYDSNNRGRTSSPPDIWSISILPTAAFSRICWRRRLYARCPTCPIKLKMCN